MVTGYTLYHGVYYVGTYVNIIEGGCMCVKCIYIRNGELVRGP